MAEFRKLDPVTDGRILKTGRRTGREEHLPLHWTGSGVTLTLACTCLEAGFETGYRVHAPWIAVLVDGAPVGRFPLLPGKSRTAVLAGMSPAMPHTVTLVRDTQPVEGDGDALHLTALYTDGQVLETPVPRWNIGFLGDSLTVGEGCLGPRDGKEWITAWMSGSLAFGGTALRALHARGRFLCQGGYGVFCGWNGDPDGNLPRLYDAVCLPEGQQEPYDFSADPLDAVVINLGTNDRSALLSLPEEERPGRERELTRAAAAFLKRVREREKKAVLLWTYGMCGDGYAHVFQRAVEERVREGDRWCRFLPLRPAEQEEYGCRDHPAAPIQREAGLRVAREIERLLKEKNG